MTTEKAPPSASSEHGADSPEGLSEPVPPVTDNERDAALIRKVLTVHSGADFLADDFPTLEEGQDAWHALTRLVAALSAATTERDEALRRIEELERERDYHLAAFDAAAATIQERHG